MPILIIIIYSIRRMCVDRTYVSIFTNALRYSHISILNPQQLHNININYTCIVAY